MNRGGKSSGQALLIVLLVLSVALTTGLALVARTTTDISISEKEAASSKAFEAAEAGIEEVLKKIEVGETVPSTFEFVLEPGGERADVIVQSEPIGEMIRRQIYPGQVATFWLNKINLDGEDFPASDISYGGADLTFCWSGAENLEAAVYYDDGGYKVARYYLSGGEGCQGLVKSGAISGLPAGTKFVNVRFYGGINDVVTVTVNETLPRQGTIVEAEARVGDVVRKVSVFQGWPQVPQFFDFAVLSEGNLTKTE